MPGKTHRLHPLLFLLRKSVPAVFLLIHTIGLVSEALAQAVPPTPDHLVESIQNKATNDVDTANAIRDLRDLGAKALFAIPALSDVLSNAGKTHETGRRREAAEALGCIGRDALNGLNSLPGDKDEDGMHARLKLGTELLLDAKFAPAVRAMTGLLKKTSPARPEHEEFLASEIAIALGRLSWLARSAVTALAAVAADSNSAKSVRIEVAYALKEIEGAAADQIPPAEGEAASAALSLCLVDDDMELQIAAAKALKEFGYLARNAVGRMRERLSRDSLNPAEARACKEIAQTLVHVGASVASRSPQLGVIELLYLRSDLDKGAALLKAKTHFTEESELLESIVKKLREEEQSRSTLIVLSYAWKTALAWAALAMFCAVFDLLFPVSARKIDGFLSRVERQELWGFKWDPPLNPWKTVKKLLGVRIYRKIFHLRPKEAELTQAYPT